MIHTHGSLLARSHAAAGTHTIIFKSIIIYILFKLFKWVVACHWSIIDLMEVQTRATERFYASRNMFEFEKCNSVGIFMNDYYLPLFVFHSFLTCTEKVRHVLINFSLLPSFTEIKQFYKYFTSIIFPPTFSLPVWFASRLLLFPYGFYMCNYICVESDI